MTTLTTLPQPSRAIYDLLAEDPSWDLGLQMGIPDQHSRDAKPLDVEAVVKDILAVCRAQDRELRNQAHLRVFDLMCERYWGTFEHQKILKACALTEAELDLWCQTLLDDIRTSASLATVHNSLEQLKVCKATVPPDILQVTSRHRRLVFPSFDLLLEQTDLAEETRTTLLIGMARKLDGYRLLLAIRLLGDSAPADLRKALLAKRITSIGQFGFPIEDNIETYLELLRLGRLKETLAAGYPGADIISNLAKTYAELSGQVFWEEDEDYDDVLTAFMDFTSYLSQTTFDTEGLHDLFLIHQNLIECDAERQRRDGLDLRSAADQIEAVLQSSANKESVLSQLDDVTSPMYPDLIEIAGSYYGADRFEFHFNYAQHAPIEAFSLASWLDDLSDDQCRRVMDWVRSQLPTSVLSQPLERGYEYSKLERKLLSETISRSDHLLKNTQGRNDILKWGLSSSDIHLAASAAYQLEKVSFSDWPDGAIDILKELALSMAPRWTSWKTEERKYVTAKDRLSDLVKAAEKSVQGNEQPK